MVPPHPSLQARRHPLGLLGLVSAQFQGPTALVGRRVGGGCKAPGPAHSSSEWLDNRDGVKTEKGLWEQTQSWAGSNTSRVLDRQTCNHCGLKGDPEHHPQAGSCWGGGRVQAGKQGIVGCPPPPPPPPAVGPQFPDSLGKTTGKGSAGRATPRTTFSYGLARHLSCISQTNAQRPCTFLTPNSGGEENQDVGHTSSPNPSLSADAVLRPIQKINQRHTEDVPSGPPQPSQPWERAHRAPPPPRGKEPQLLTTRNPALLRFWLQSDSQESCLTHETVLCPTRTDKGAPGKVSGCTGAPDQLLLAGFRPSLTAGLHLVLAQLRRRAALPPPAPGHTPAFVLPAHKAGRASPCAGSSSPAGGGPR
ncbi:uncharacterized protein LOC124237902 [Equus quagga]|uniref:uncharacterized protein LOC124237902 n=1 Tax=Equus quagga TaxID=89248 RepID=UPI001EE33118|nr:uncharacterized protein LOC124237902 [Equus quagga]XP_046513957.1 uncharacterized protein LOC124237902 [Equus quagga]XP_046513958.1 uncharacterized protein LOC124237902 [Equus quagga]XP_046513959.1 uncharacterized protein LOC124237902 [Equus quagga]XP_046513960.1 uncharacterized protein LOC124237902 [Equus quagga]XP_046513961.1 uncharacterized protein LOC124237902 [Equus quagga]XP_046513962.1 uncharacterized protein LOC124237902 [Equus quagga]XP_046513963.1 uncharacterized protein LOC1242